MIITNESNEGVNVELSGLKKILHRGKFKYNSHPCKE